MLTHEEKQIHNSVHAELREFEEFKELVRRMREAQMDKAIVEARVRFKHEERLEITEEDHKLYASAIDKAVVLEDDVDEYLKKMEL